MAINTDPEIHKLIICANVFIRRDDKFLVLRRSELKRYAPGVVHPVGGKVELGEDAYAAAAREAREETGLEVKSLRLEAVINEIAPPPDRSVNWLIFHFSADYAGGEVAETDEGQLAWLTADEIKAAKLFPSVKPVIAEMLDPGKGTVFATFQYTDRGEIDDAATLMHTTAP